MATVKRNREDEDQTTETVVEIKTEESTTIKVESVENGKEEKVESESVSVTKKQKVEKGDKDEEVITKDGKKLTKKKVAIVFGYNGLEFQGLQKNPGAHTIEEEIEKALYATGGINDTNFNAIAKIDWMRAARTDKGVHAVSNVISLKLLFDAQEPFDKYVERVNEKLPPTIRIFGIQRTLSMFHAKNAVDYRVYEYICPTYALVPISAGTGAKFNEEHLTKMRELFTVYEGTYNYHNFTQKMKANDPTAKRHIRTIKVSDAFEMHGIEVVKITLYGQSFILHQIRKMIGLVMMCMRFGASWKIIFHCLKSKGAIHFLMAPGEFLMLDRPVFNAYNRKLDTIKSEFSELDIRVWDEPREQFKISQIYKIMIEKEKATKTMAKFATQIDRCHIGIEDKDVDIWNWIKEVEAMELNWIRPPAEKPVNKDWL